MKTNKIFALLIGMLLLAVVAAVAQPMPQPQKRGFQRGARMLRALNLTKEQRTKMMDMRLSMQREMIPLKSKMMTLRNDLKLEVTANNFNQGKVNRTIDQIANVRKQISLAMINHLRQVRNMLTPEQQQKFDLMVLNMGKGKFGPGRHMGPRGGMWRGNRMGHSWAGVHPGMRPNSNNWKK